MKKRLIAFLLACLTLLSFCACGGISRGETEGTTAAEAATTSSAPSALTDAPAETTVPATAAPETTTGQPAETTVPVTTGSPVPPGQPEETASGMPLLWKVSDASGHKLYLFGTMHVGDERSEAVLDRLSPLLETSDALAVEYDEIAYEKNVSEVQKDLSQYLLTDGSIFDYMPDLLRGRAFDLLTQADIFQVPYLKFNLAWWRQLVDSAMLKLFSDLDNDRSMDRLLTQRAYEKNIPVLEVESAGFQATLLNSFDNELYLLLIEESLDSKQTYKAELDREYELWLSGDRKAFWEFVASEEVRDEGKYTERQIAMIEDYLRRLREDRNLTMLDRIVEYLAGNKTVFFAVGAGHMANEKGLVKLLTDAGYTVETAAY